MKQMGLFQLMDCVMADALEVDLDVYTNVIDEFNDDDMTFIIETMMEAEDFLLKTFSSDSGQFYSIRKIYF